MAGCRDKRGSPLFFDLGRLIAVEAAFICAKGLSQKLRIIVVLADFV